MLEIGLRMKEWPSEGQIRKDRVNVDHY
jgi:hypothetical protein